jgi:hypothetical protein
MEKDLRFATRAEIKTALCLRAVERMGCKQRFLFSSSLRSDFVFWLFLAGFGSGVKIKTKSDPIIKSLRGC